MEFFGVGPEGRALIDRTRGERIRFPFEAAGERGEQGEQGERDEMMMNLN